MTPRVTIALFGLVATALFDVGEAQPCGAAGVRHIVRAEDGRVLDERELDAVHLQSPKPVGDDDIGVSRDAVSRSADGSYWLGAADGTKIPVLHFRRTTNECSLRLVEVTLVRADRRMRLIFDLDLPMKYGDRGLFSGGRQWAADVVVDSPPFSDGTFRLDKRRLAEWRWSSEQPHGYPIAYPVIPAEFWLAEPAAD